jgi:hypothetical protein
VKGMMKPLTVVAALQSRQPTELQAELALTLRDFALELPSEIMAGAHTWKVTNAGPEPHEITLVKLSDGYTVENLMGYLRAPIGPPPFTFAGGIGGMSAGQTAWVTMDLKPGEYVAFCPIPSFAHEGKPHHDLGMLTSFRVIRDPSEVGPSQSAPWVMWVLGLLAVGTVSAVLWRDRFKSNGDKG